MTEGLSALKRAPIFTIALCANAGIILLGLTPRLVSAPSFFMPEMNLLLGMLLFYFSIALMFYRHPSFVRTARWILVASLLLLSSAMDRRVSGWVHGPTTILLELGLLIFVVRYLWLVLTSYFGQRAGKKEWSWDWFAAQFVPVFLFIHLVFGVGLTSFHGPYHRVLMNEIRTHSALKDVRAGLKAFKDLCEGYPDQLVRISLPEEERPVSCDSTESASVSLRDDGAWSGSYQRENFLENRLYHHYRILYLPAKPATGRRDIFQSYELLVEPEINGQTGDRFFRLADSGPIQEEWGKRATINSASSDWP